MNSPLKNLRRIRANFTGSLQLSSEIWILLLGLLREGGDLKPEYRVSPTGSREKRWRDKFRVLDLDSITEELALHPADGIMLQYREDEPGAHNITLSHLHAVGAVQPFFIGEQREPCEIVRKNNRNIMHALATHPNFISGVLHETYYSSWMNTGDIKYYNRFFGDSTLCQLKSRPSGEISYSGEIKEVWRIDTSKHPGRIEACVSGARTVAADMWLGPRFWTHAACTPEEVRAQSWLRIEENKNYMHINCWPEPFTRPDGEQGELQRKLWRLLFNGESQWPPKGDLPNS